jgi:DNA-binding NarL/FixJ family response regulator
MRHYRIDKMTLHELISPDEHTDQSRPLRILIVDDEAINRLGLRYLLTSLPGIEVVAEATNGVEAIEMTAIHSPDMILMDLTMPEMDGIATTRAIRKSKPDTKILVLTSAAGHGNVSQALEAGAQGYCMKDSNPAEFLTALNVVRKGNVFLDAKVLPALLDSMSSQRSTTKTHSSNFNKTDAYAPLSAHELEVLSMKMRGINDEEMARVLGVSLDTIKRMECEIKGKIFDLESRPAQSQGREMAAARKAPANVRFCEHCHSVFSEDIQICPNDGTKLIDEQTSKWIGTTLDGKYELLTFLGKGGGASVFKGNHKFLNQKVAIKIIHGEHSTDFTMLQRFRGEAEISSKLNHPNIVQVYDFGVIDSGKPYLVMEFLEGVNLANYLKSYGKLSCNEILTIFWQICSALECAHKSDLIHRDIKPSNIFIAKMSDGDKFVKLLDFGLAKSIQPLSREDALTGHGQIVGTPDYMSPETCRGIEYTRASDIYSLGCSMFECLSGLTPFQGTTIPEIMYRHINDPAPRLFAQADATPLESALARIISKCLEKDPGNRYASATEIKTELLELPLIA